jgi:hypothetical protein
VNVLDQNVDGLDVIFGKEPADFFETEAQANVASMAATLTQKQKSECLYNTQHPVNRIDTKKVMVNLTDRTLNPAATAILSKGLNFAQMSNIRVNLKNFISSVERAIQHLPSETVEEVRQETSYTS